MLSFLEQRLAERRRIYLLRHAEVSYFHGDGTPLRTEDAPLTEHGQEQARIVADMLSGVTIDRVVTSGLPRTIHTAEIICRGRSLAIESCPALAEIRPGKLAAWGDAQARQPLPVEQLFVQALSRNISAASRFLGGESFGEFQDRVVPAFRRILEDQDWKSLLLVAHGGTNRLMLVTALGAQLAQMGALEQDSGCLNIVDVNGDGSLFVRLVNYTPEDPAKENVHLSAMEKILADNVAAFQALARAASRGDAPE